MFFYLYIIIISAFFFINAVRRATYKSWVLSFIAALPIILPYLIFGEGIGFDLHNDITGALNIQSVLYLVIHYIFIFSITVYQKYRFTAFIFSFTYSIFLVGALLILPTLGGGRRIFLSGFFVLLFALSFFTISSVYLIIKIVRQRCKGRKKVSRNSNLN